MRVAFDVARFILSTLFRTIAQKFSMGDRSEIFPHHIPFLSKSQSCPGTTAWSWWLCELGLRPVEKYPAIYLAEI